jgi:(4-(4-[2-(gamma-L-glutamylamino)ethyl]phenoxymethyl)furan-2-yl)methanamine synthase
MREVIGWDIGGVNTKVARVAAGAVTAVVVRPYELQRAPGALGSLLQALAAEVGAGAGALHAVTMTAELSQMFRTKREGVSFVLDAVEGAFAAPAEIRVFAADGRFLTPEDARGDPLAVAAANWSATARAVVRHHRDVVLIDIGTTTTDIIPIVGGAVRARGRTDLERLACGELVYTGALRTPTEALATHVTLHGTAVGASAEGFALAGDVHMWRGHLNAADYTVSAPDGRPATRAFAGERLARVVCADRDMLDDAAVSSIADALADAQVARIAEDVRRVAARHPSLQAAVVTGLGAFIGRAAAERAGLRSVMLSAELGDAASRCAPAVSVALLADESGGQSERPAQEPSDSREAASQASRRLEAVVKIGGGALANLGDFDAALAAIGAAGRGRRLLVVPGGGPFADAVRDVDRRLQLSDTAAHWMAVLAMDQSAHLVAARLAGSQVVVDAPEIDAALAAGVMPVLAPSRWMRDRDALPHSWDVTSDSIAAWVAGQLGARRLVLIKPSGAAGSDLLDPYFHRALFPGTAVATLSADRAGELEHLLSSM